MNTKLIMLASAVFLAAIGLSLTFMPAEIAAYLDMSTTSEFRIILQLLGALYFAFAMLNWMAKGSLLGGIYNRPIVIANSTHFLIGGLALGKALLNNPQQPVSSWIFTVVYVVFAICFGVLLNRHPIKEN